MGLYGRIGDDAVFFCGACCLGKAESARTAVPRIL